MADPAAAAPASTSDRYPKQVKYIIGNEGAERFSFYGMRNILVAYLISGFLMTEADAKSTFHLFVAAVYWFPLIGGYLADRFLGKYRTILYLSLVYTAGHACLAIFETVKPGFYLGLALIAIGSGGIKPCVSSFVGDQFDQSNKHLVKGVFGLFYWIINFGSFFASLSIPKTLEWFGPSIAFGIPGILMAIATVVFWLGRKHYVDVPPTGKNPHSFSRVIAAAWRNRGRKPAGGHWLDAAGTEHPAHSIDGAKAVFRVLPIFAMVPVFWALFDQKASTWVVQAMSMDLMVGDWKMAPSQLQALNPLMVMILVPFTNLILYPGLEKVGVKVTALRRMTLGMFVAGSAYFAVAGIQVVMDGGTMLSVLWQAIPYLLLTMAEVLISVTGLEFAYTQAPPEMKGTIMSFWNLTVTVGNLLVAGIASLNVFEGPAASMTFYGALICAAGVVFWLIGRGYKHVEYIRPAGTSPSNAAIGRAPANPPVSTKDTPK